MILNKKHDIVLQEIKDLVENIDRTLFVEHIECIRSNGYHNNRYTLYTRFNGNIKLTVWDNNHYLIKIDTKQCNSVDYKTLLFINELDNLIKKLLKILA